MTDAAELSAAVLDWFAEGYGLGGPPPGQDPLGQRLVLAGRGLADGTTGPADWAVLVRHLLQRRRFSRPDEPDPTLVVPAAENSRGAGKGWPTTAVWRRHGVRAAAESGDGGGRVRLRADDWLPDWLDGGGRSPAAAAFAGDRRRQFGPAPADPFLSTMGLPSYMCPGQRSALHNVLTTPPGGILLTVLPTGTGKSLCAQVPALLEGDALTVVVCPTTALCIDQAAAVEPAVGQPSAYHGGAAAGPDIISRIYDGTQRIVFTSPEALCDVLSRPVYAAARAGRLAWLVIDEAHVVEQWGDEFRPHFQVLAGLRQDLLRQSPRPFRTLLLSATVTESCLTTLRTLFGGDGSTFVVGAAVQVRPEPSYWVSRCDGEQAADVRRDRVLDALRHLPRPLILYTTEVAEAKRWHERLRDQEKYTRVGVMHGKSSPADRERLIDRWRRRDLDVVVATAAFGLGMDQQDVRAVVHACVPETLDRFYQEVGRGGRDGRAALSLVVHTPRDLEVADRINAGAKKQISVELGLERWRQLFHGTTVATDGRCAVDVGTGRLLSMGDNDENLKWNLRTLNLMAKAGLVALDGSPPPDVPADWEADGARTAYFDALHRWYHTRVVRPLADATGSPQRHLERATWDRVVEPVRRRIAEAAERNLRHLHAVLGGVDCVGRVLRQLYEIDRSVPVAWACGGCHWCRSQVPPRPAGADVMPTMPPAWPPTDDVGAALRSHLRGGPYLAMFYTPPADFDARKRFAAVVGWACRQGVQNVVAAGGRAGLAEQWSDLARRRVFVHDLDTVKWLLLPPVPTLVIHPPGRDVPAGCYQPTAGRQTTPARVVMVPEGAEVSGRGTTAGDELDGAASVTLAALATQEGL